MKIKFQTKAWITEYNSVSPQELQTPEGAATLTFARGDMTNCGWTYAGDASITVDIPDVKTLFECKVEALRNQAANIRAEATAKCTAIEGQIQQLLCIENAPAKSPLDQYLED